VSQSNAIGLRLFLLSLLCVAGLAGAGVGSVRAAVLPDGRAYELVTPPDLVGYAFPLGTSEEPFASPTWNAVSADGNSVLWAAFTAPAGMDIDATGYVNTFVSRRGPGTSGWTSTFVSPPGSRSVGGGPNPIYASPDLQTLLWKVFGSDLDPSDSDSVPLAQAPLLQDYFRRNSDGTFTRMTQGSLELPVTDELVKPVGASVDGLKLVFYDPRQLESDATAGSAIYQRAGNKTTVVSKDELGNALPNPLGLATSEDANIVLFADNGNQTLYLRDVAAATTTVVATGNALKFEALSANGKRVFFLTDTALTSDDTDTSVDLYEYDAASESLHRISAPTGAPAAAGPGNTDTCAAPAFSCGASGVAVSRDGSKAYFVSPEQLDGSRGINGGRNLYLNDDGEVRFVATLDPGDPDFGDVIGEGGTSVYSLNRHVRLTPDGQKLIFESRASVTGYDNAGHNEIYVYDSVMRTLVCASCRPSGAPPTADAGLREGVGAGFSPMFSKDPVYPLNSDEHGEHIFFHSGDGILPQDTNGQFDVYEYTVSNGSVSLISSGVSPNHSTYLGNARNGDDVFFFTTDKLVPQDTTGNLYKLYDARRGGGIPFSAGPPKCTGAGCRGTDPAGPDVVDSGTNQLEPGSRPSPGAPASKLTVSGTRSVTGTVARLTARVSGAGRLRVTGTGLVAASVKTSRAASYRLTVKLSKVAAARLKRTHRATASATVRFVPKAGASRSVTVRLTFKSVANQKGR
jgi:hypothetical protein